MKYIERHESIIVVICFIGFLIAGCQPPTPAQEVQLLKAELTIASVKCSVYTTQQKYPRDVSVTEKCNKLLKP